MLKIGHNMITNSILVWCLIRIGINAAAYDYVSSSNKINRNLKYLYEDVPKCGAANLTVEKIDHKNREIKFSWSGLKNKDGIRYDIKCYNTRFLFDSYDTFDCDDTTDISQLKKRTTEWDYFFDDSRYYCAIVSSGGYPVKRSNIVAITTPGSFRVGFSASLYIYIVLSAVGISIMVLVLSLYCRRKSRRQMIATGLVLSRPTPNLAVAPQVASGPYVQQPPSYPPPSYQNQVLPPAQPPQYGINGIPYGSQAPNPWGNPPPYAEQHLDKNPM